MSPSPETLLQRLHLDTLTGGDGPLAARSPIDGAVLARLPVETAADADRIVAQAHAAFRNWRTVPAPRRGELVRLLGEELRAHKADLGALVTLEAGKITQEGLGEVQEMIDICDFAVGLSRQLYGLTIASERPAHRMMETWHPLGPCLVITAFNFPVAVWAWNATLALVCGDPVIWKPSEKTPLTALAVERLFLRACQRFGEAPPHLAQVAIGAHDLGEALACHPGVPLVSATGSTGMGRAVAQAAAPRFARTILELGGNNAA
ncbi:aldehyde dehydrogenase family protein, partial [Ralstonia pseudosolanacearum]